MNLTLDQARRIALASQGFDRPRLRRAGVAAITRTIRRLGLVQIDYANVLLPAQYQVIYSRLGPFDRSHFHEAVYGRGKFTEQWAHEASIVPMETWPLLRDRMETHRIRPWHFAPFIEEHAEYVDWVLAEVRGRGALTADELPAPEGAPRRISNSWFGSVPRAVLEAHFGRGLLAVTDRRSDFSRVYDLAERVIPVEHHGRCLPRADAHRELVRTAARAQGIATAGDLADYFRMPVGDVRPGLADLVSAGEVLQVRVDGWREPAYLHAEAPSPRRIGVRTLLSPFDPVIWTRARVARLFEFEYRFEIFVPPAKRRWGCYVLPFLMDDRLVARVDLKADRNGGRLLVQAAYIEAHAEAAEVAPALAAELAIMAEWLGLDTVIVERHGSFAKPLASAIRRLA